MDTKNYTADFKEIQKTHNSNPKIFLKNKALWFVNLSVLFILTIVDLVYGE